MQLQQAQQPGAHWQGGGQLAGRSGSRDKSLHYTNDFSDIHDRHPFFNGSKLGKEVGVSDCNAALLLQEKYRPFGHSRIVH